MDKCVNIPIHTHICMYVCIYIYTHKHNTHLIMNMSITRGRPQPRLAPRGGSASPPRGTPEILGFP